MDVNGFIDAASSPVFNQWKQANTHVAPWDEMEVIDIIQSSQFQSWLAANPEGTIDQYYQHLCQLQAYQQSPQYQIQVLQGEVDELTAEISDLRTEAEELHEEIGNKDKTIEHLQAVSTGFTISTLLLIAISLYLIFRIRRK